MATNAFTRLPSAEAGQFFTDSLQRGLAHWNHERLAPGFPHEDWQKTLERDVRMLRLEGGFIEALRDEVADEAAAAPTEVDAFVAWFEALRDTGFLTTGTPADALINGCGAPRCRRAGGGRPRRKRARRPSSPMKFSAGSAIRPTSNRSVSTT